MFVNEINTTRYAHTHTHICADRLRQAHTYVYAEMQMQIAFVCVVSFVAWMEPK